MQAPRGRQQERSAMPIGRAALIASVGGQRGWRSRCAAELIAHRAAGGNDHNVPHR
jgi:hypothetical protein